MRLILFVSLWLSGLAIRARLRGVGRVSGRVSTARTRPSASMLSAQLLVFAILATTRGSKTPGPESGPSPDEIRFVLDTAYRELRRLTVGHYLAEDASQVAAMKLIERWDATGLRMARTRSERYWSNYIRKTARNSYLDMIRTDSRRRGREDRAVSGEASMARAGSRGWMPGADDDELAWFLVEDAIGKLRSELREPARLYFLEDLSTEQVADRLKITEQRARKLRRQAELRLVELLRDDDELGGGTGDY